MPEQKLPKSRSMPMALLVLMLALGVWTFASAQGISATATSPPAQNPQLVLLQKQLVALQKRVAELEKEQVGQAGSSDDSDQAEARNKLIQRRLAALERASSDTPAKRDEGSPRDGDGEDSITVKAPFVVHDKAGRTIFRVDTVGDRPIVVVGNPMSTMAVLGINGDGNSSLRLYDGKRGLGVDLVAESGGGNLALLNGKAREVVSLSVDKAGAGRVKVANASGSSVAGMLSDATGGRVLVADNSTGRSLVALSTSAEGGMVNVYSKTGADPRAQLVADDRGGIVSVINAQGVATAAMETTQAGSGRLIIANSGGDIMVEAGVAPKGFGMVRAGPGGRGPAGVVGGTVQLASSIQGRE